MSDNSAATDAATDETLTEEDVYEALEEVIDPELGLDFVSLGLVYEVNIEGSEVYVRTDEGVRRRPPRRRSRASQDGLRPRLEPGADD